MLHKRLANVTAGTIETRIEEFSNYFYNTFEKENLKINKYKNTFIPISSISYKAELSLEKLSSFLIFHLIKISLETNEDDLSFIEKIKNSVDNILENDEDLEFEIKKLTKKISPNEKELIMDEIEKFNNIKNQICYAVDINKEINMKKREHYETIYKLFYLNKKKVFPIQNSKLVIIFLETNLLRTNFVLYRGIFCTCIANHTRQHSFFFQFFSIIKDGIATFV